MSKLKENPLYLALKEGKHSLTNYMHTYDGKDLLEDIEALLTAQREKCGDIVADSAASLYETELEEKVRTAKLF